MTPEPLIRVRQLSHGWPGLALFDRLDIDILPGLTLVTGDEGCGKSTLLRLLARDAPDRTCLQDMQDPALDQTRVDLLLDGVPADWVDGFGLTPHRDKPLYMLSTGSRRKVGLCRTLVHRAPVLLIDQPVAALDPPSIRYLAERVNAVARQPGHAVVVADYEPPPGMAIDQVLTLPTR
jgi:ABC-type multidrug transport system ATPase subunit